MRQHWSSRHVESELQQLHLDCVVQTFDTQYDKMQDIGITHDAAKY